MLCLLHEPKLPSLSMVYSWYCMLKAKWILKISYRWIWIIVLNPTNKFFMVTEWIASPLSIFCHPTVIRQSYHFAYLNLFFMVQYAASVKLKKHLLHEKKTNHFRNIHVYVNTKNETLQMTSFQVSCYPIFLHWKSCCHLPVLQSKALAFPSPSFPVIIFCTLVPKCD